MKTTGPLLRLFALSLLLVAPLGAAVLESAKITFVQHDVAVADLSVLTTDEKGEVQRRPAALNESVDKDNAVLTGRKSRAELEFNDGTLTRLGQLTSFTFTQGTREVNLKQGSALFVVPKGVGGATIKAGPVTAAITGTTLLIQVFGDRVVIYVYEGTVVAAGQTITAGQVLTIPSAGDPVLASFDIAKGIETAALFSKFVDAPSQERILLEIDPVLAAFKAGRIDEAPNTGHIDNAVNNQEPFRGQEPQGQGQLQNQLTAPGDTIGK